jgi:hypothetical protein
MSGAPNSRFMKELLVICPTHPAARASVAGRASWKKRYMNGTVSAYVPLHVAYRSRYPALSALSFAVM